MANFTSVEYFQESMVKISARSSKVRGGPKQTGLRKFVLCVTLSKKKSFSMMTIEKSFKLNKSVTIMYLRSDGVPDCAWYFGLSYLMPSLKSGFWSKQRGIPLGNTFKNHFILKYEVYSFLVFVWVAEFFKNLYSQSVVPKKGNSGILFLAITAYIYLNIDQ